MKQNVLIVTFLVLIIAVACFAQGCGIDARDGENPENDTVSRKTSPTIVSNAADSGQQRNNPMRLGPDTLVSGNAVIVFFQFSNSVILRNVTDTQGDTFRTCPNLPLNVTGSQVYVGCAIAYNIHGGSTTFQVNLSGSKSSWGLVSYVEIGHCPNNCLDASPAGVNIADTGAIGATVNGPSIKTLHVNEIMFGYAAPNLGEIALSNGDVGCCVSGVSLAAGDPGAGLSYQVISSNGTYHAQFADTVAHDSMGIISVSVY
jgi:hypothetical protein